MRWTDCPKNPLMSCSREDCIEGGCRLIVPRAQEPWPSPKYIPRPREKGAEVFNAQQRIEKLEAALRDLLRLVEEDPEEDDPSPYLFDQVCDRARAALEERT